MNRFKYLIDDDSAFVVMIQAELLEADERAGRRYIQQIEELRDQLEREKDAACTRERELAQQRLALNQR